MFKLFKYRISLALLLQMILYNTNANRQVCEFISFRCDDNSYALSIAADLSGEI